MLMIHYYAMELSESIVTMINITGTNNAHRNGYDYLRSKTRLSERLLQYDAILNVHSFCGRESLCFAFTCPRINYSFALDYD